MCAILSCKSLYISSSSSVVIYRIVDGDQFWEREYTKYLLVATTDALGSPPVTSERRFSEIIKFHHNL